MYVWEVYTADISHASTVLLLVTHAQLAAKYQDSLQVSNLSTQIYTHIHVLRTQACKPLPITGNSQTPNHHQHHTTTHPSTRHIHVPMNVVYIVVHVHPRARSTSYFYVYLLEFVVRRSSGICSSATRLTC